jgi:AmiR/NasT family two-component response regulator
MAERQLADVLIEMADTLVDEFDVLEFLHVLTEQLQTALNGRIAVEQAKGVLAERHGVDMHEAFAMLRHQSNVRNRRLSELAKAIVEGAVRIDP